MLKQSLLSRLGISLLAGVLLAPVLRAQVSPKEFGPGSSVTIVDFHDFLPANSAAGWGGVNERSSTADLTAAINMLPNGSILNEVDFFVRDDDAGGDFTGSVCWNWVRSTSGEAGAGSPACTATVSSSGTPGEFRLLPLLPDLEIQHFQDIDTDGFDDIVSYYIRAQGGTPDLTIRTVRLTWRRRVTPAPVTASFNDVPTSHPFFQFVEALAASGITVGCGSGNFCPDEALKRGQMAVFLAKALGLQWD